MKFVIAGITLLVAWIIVAFGMALESGWAHLPLAAGVVLIAIGIVLGGESRRRDGVD